ncbi:MAG: fumarylacetoacetase [Pseudomonadales bacterium]
MVINATHDPTLKSWVSSANRPGAEFPIQNLPFASLRRAGTNEPFRLATAIGDYALDLTALLATGRVSQAFEYCVSSRLNQLMAAGTGVWHQVRAELSDLLRQDALDTGEIEACLIPLSDVEYDVPALIGDYTDFYTSIHHATNIGKLFRPDNPLLPNYEWVPIGYHGRSSSIGVNQSFPRPRGQLKQTDAQAPQFEACRRLDYELEVGILIGAENPLGQPVSINQAEQHIFGLCLLNDWSARDIQAWEYQPLGPFLAKSFASTISPWVVTMEALAPFRAPFTRDPERAKPLPYLSSAQNSQQGAIDIQLEVFLQTPPMNDANLAPERLSQSNFTDAFWTAAQMVTHHTSNGCNLRVGDLFGSGTMSGVGPGSQGALIEITQGGVNPVTLGNGEQRCFLEDGDRVILRGQCQRDGFVSIGFGECIGQVLPAVS